MKKKPITKNRIYDIVAAAIFVIAGLAVCLFLNRTPKLSYDIAVFGDSLLGEARDETGICGQIADALDVRVLNAALGGTGISRSDTLKRLAAGRDGLSMAELVRSVTAEDFSVQQTIHIREGGTEYFDETIDDMAAADFDSVKLFLIEYGLNDFHMGTPLDDPQDPYNEYTYAGAVRSVAKRLHRAYPGARIIFMTPTYAWYLAKEQTGEEIDMGCGTLNDYVETLIETAKESDLEVIDLYHDVYPHDTWEDHARFTRDGMHPNEEGRALIAAKIIEYLQKNP